MTYASTAARRTEADRATLVVLGGFALILASVLLSRQIAAVAAVVGLGTVLVAWHRTILRWPAVVGLLISIMLFVPIGRYSIPIGLPFGLELYRLAVAFVLAGWAASLLADSSVRLRRSPFDIPIVIIVCATLGSVAVNTARVTPLGAVVLKAITFFLSFIFIYYFLVSVVRKRRTVESLTKFLVAGSAVVAIFAIIEQRTGFNIFDHVDKVIPILRFDGASEVDRLGLVRAMASSAHPIELGVLLAIALPLGLALAFGSSRRWWIPTAILAVGVMSSASRTPILVLVTAGVVLLWLKPRDIKRLLPLLVPLVVVVKLALPGSVATLKNAFFPAGGLVQEQTELQANYDPLLSGGRVRQIGPMLDEASRRPLLGEGFATRQTGFNNPLRNAPILDNQWLGVLLELGIIGIAGWAALFVCAARGLGRASRRRAGPEGWLAAGFAAAIAGFGIAMFTFDAFAFTQVTFVFWILVALTASLLLDDSEEGSSAFPATASRRALT